MHVRTATVADVVGVVRLLDEVDAFYGDEVTESAADRSAAVTRELFGDAPSAYVLLAVAEEGAPVGFLAYSTLWPAAGSTASLYVKELFVTEAHRRNGTGRLLLAEVCRIAVARGMSRVELTTDRANRDARSFYARLGVPPHDGKILYRLDGGALRALADA